MRALLASFVLLFTACGVQFTPETLVNALRIMAATRDARQKRAGAGEAALLSAALADAVTKLKAQERATAARAEASERMAGELAWNLYTVPVRSMIIDFAITENEEGSLVALLQSAPDERDGLFDHVLLPMIDALAIIQ